MKKLMLWMFAVILICSNMVLTSCSKTDHSVSIVSVGFLTCLAQLLQSATGNVRYQKPVDDQWSAMILEKIRTVNKMR